MNSPKYDIGHYVQVKPKGTSGGNLKIYIPLIMKFAMGEAKQVPASINTSLFAHSSECKPAVSKTIMTQNYATADAPPNPYAFGIYYFGDTLSLIPNIQDYLEVALTNDIDNSKPV